MEDYNALEFREFLTFYSYDNELYCPSFPKVWVTSHLSGSGPKECYNCSYYGSWNGVFIGYCSNCAEHIYNNTRGYGFNTRWEEVIPINCDPSASAMSSYLLNINFDLIGDKELFNSKKKKMQLFNNHSTLPLISKYPVQINYDDYNISDEINDFSDNETNSTASYTCISSVDNFGYICEETTRDLLLPLSLSSDNNNYNNVNSNSPIPLTPKTPRNYYLDNFDNTEDNFNNLLEYQSEEDEDIYEIDFNNNIGLGIGYNTFSFTEETYGSSYNDGYDSY